MVLQEFTFRGKTLDELQKMDLKEFSKLCTARARRTLLRRGVDEKIMKKIKKTKELLAQGKKVKPIRTHKRDMIIIPEMIGITFGVHNGKEFVPITIEKEMLGHYLGEFALTRKRVKHGKAGIGATKSSTALAAKKV